MPPASRFHHIHRLMLHRLLVAAAVALIALPAAAQSADQTVTIVVPQVEQIAVADAAVTINFTAPTAGNAFADATATSSYSITVNTTGNKITGQLDGDYASGISLAVALGAPSGATSANSVTLGSTSAVDLVSGVSTVSATGLGITYTASATAGVAPNGGGESQTVTYTITDV